MYAEKLNNSQMPLAQSWKTCAGTMRTQAKVEARFTLPELFDSHQIKWDVHVADSLGAYDMIIG